MKNLLVIILFAVKSHLLTAQTATQVITKADEKMQGKTNRGTMTMKIVRPKWTREITMKVWGKGVDYSLVLITEPARDEGTGTLKRDKELWSWQPSIDRIIKMPPSMMMQSWMGSDFTNDDLVNQSSMVVDYSHEFIGDTTIGLYDCWKIVMYPQEDAAVVWGKLEAYISKVDYFQLIIKYYDEDEFLINTMTLYDIREMGGRVIPTKMEMIPAENPDQKTVIIYRDFEYDIDLKESFFSVQNLKTIR
ncbi:MAG: outer membrane lipoprotein-sorting protein [Flammeovirgaceae bacterium]|nr:outer membrane lipoprotein-sorting protein [Flammeovirgaceae bacterium]|tara:strand:+ start:1330 stop:2073 length:744 start_codon:yes stop_codon:yes gene_type:complete